MDACELSQKEIAELAGISYIYYQGIKSRRRPNPSLNTIKKLAIVYGLAIHELFSPKPPAVRIQKRPPKAPRRPSKKATAD